ncbi:hypothetical protein [Candidatus Albibeggiatoa sp. nov. NOAA]|uniref:hypothetical protein n=1 Tax=Candidatus Albibeggiatoa sp. nov. NOAA TaxID=3162724 RepID=UPI0032F242E1|nr:hypothetical protein [Thiotrichaceae bacterium]
MVTITSSELDQFRTAFQDNDDAQDALDILENCNGNLQDAASIIIGIEKNEYHLGDQDWVDFENIIKDLRKVVCNQAFEAAFVSSLTGALEYLVGKELGFSKVFLTFFVVYLSHQGFEYFCN